MIYTLERTQPYEATPLKTETYDGEMSVLNYGALAFETIILANILYYALSHPFIYPYTDTKVGKITWVKTWSPYTLIRFSDGDGYNLVGIYDFEVGETYQLKVEHKKIREYLLECEPVNR